MLSIPTAHNLLEQDNNNHVQCRFAVCAVEKKQLSVDYVRASQRTVVTNRTTLLVLTSGTTSTTITRIPNETSCCIDERAQTSNGRGKISCLSSSRYLKKRAGTRRIGRKRKTRWAGIFHPHLCRQESCRSRGHALSIGTREYGLYQSTTLSICQMGGLRILRGLYSFLREM